MSSGSTGTPKGIMLSDRIILSNVASIQSYVDLQNDDRVLLFKSLGYCSSITGEWLNCEPDTYLLNVEQAKAAVTTRTKAIIPVQLYGQMVDLSELTVWAEKRNIAIVEDSAQAAGARMNGQMAGSIGTAGCFDEKHYRSRTDAYSDCHVYFEHRQHVPYRL